MTLRSFLAPAIVAFAVSVPHLSEAAWYRTYGFGSQTKLGAVSEIAFIDDTAMPLKSLTKVRVYVDNQSPVSGSYARARCCNRSREGNPTTWTACGFFVSGATGAGAKEIDITGSDLNTCKVVHSLTSPISAVPYVNVTNDSSSNAQDFSLLAVTTEGS